MTDNTTPLQEALSRLGMMRQTENENIRMNLNANEVAMMLNSLLPKEKEFVNTVWNAGATSGYENKRVHGTCEWDKEGHAANFIDFINEIYPKQ